MNTAASTTTRSSSVSDSSLASPILRRKLAATPTPTRAVNIAFSAAILDAARAAWRVVLGADVVLSPEILAAHAPSTLADVDAVVVWAAACEATAATRRPPSARLRRALGQAVDAAALALVDADPDAVALDRCLEDMRLWGVTGVADAARDLRVAVNRMETANLRVVVSIAVRYARRGNAVDMTIDDLVGYGMLGLRTAVMRYRADRGTAFSTVADPWVKASIGRAINEKSRTIRIPVHTLQAIRRVAAARSVIRDVPLDDASLARAARVTPQKLAKVRGLLGGVGLTPISLATPITHGAATAASAVTTVEDTLVDHAALAPDEALEQMEREHACRRLLASLKSERMAAAVAWRFGLDGAHDGGAELQEIGDVLGVCRERARQMVIGGLERMKMTAIRTGVAAGLAC